MVYNTIVLCSTCLLRGGWWRDCGYDTIMLFIHIVNFNYSKHHVNKLFRLFCEFLPITFSNHELHELYWTNHNHVYNIYTTLLTNKIAAYYGTISTQKTKYWATRTPLKTRGEPLCYGRVINYCFTIGTNRATSVNFKNEERKIGLSLQQTEPIHGHLWNRYSVTVNQIISVMNST